MLPFLARPVSQIVIMAMLNKLEPFSSHGGSYGEISQAIERAVNQDPIFPHHEAGSEATASILVALAWYESKFHKSVIGDQGQSFGLFQIQPPTANVPGKLLLLPANATFIAIDLIRTSFRQCEGRPWVERLSWYIASNNFVCKGAPHPIIAKKSMDRLMLAQQLFAQFFQKENEDDGRKLPPGLPPKGEKVAKRGEKVTE